MTPYVLFYVESPEATAAALETVLGTPAVEVSATFVLVVVNGVRLGLWRRDGVRPTPEGRGESSEIAMAVAAREEVEGHHAAWLAKGLPVLQEPEEMDFGYTATVALPGPLRVRVFHPG